MKKISIVTSLYRSESYIAEFYERHLACVKQLGLDYEFVFVNDGSPDNSAARIKELIAKDPKVRLVLFSRNFGQYPAMFAGMANAKGDFVYTTDSDLEEAPENIITLYQQMMKNKDTDLVYATVGERTGGVIRKFLGGIFYNIIKWAANMYIPKNISWQFIMTRQYVNELMRFNEAETFPTGLMMLTGFNHDSIVIEKTFKGNTSYTFKKRLNLAMNAITAFSSKPLVFIGMLGILITIVTFIAIICAIISKLFFIDYRTGWISIILSIWFMGGLILSSIGIIGIYLAKIFNQVKGRPLYIIREIISAEN